MRIIILFMLMLPPFGYAEPCLSQKCNQIEALKRQLLEDEFSFAGQNGYLKLLRLLVESEHKEEALLFQKSIPIKYIPNAHLEEYEALVWQANALLIPKDARFCAPNPITYRCDSAIEVIPSLASFLVRFPNSRFLPKIIEVGQKYETYRIEKEQNEFNNYIANYEGAVRPQGLISKIIVNGIRNNDGRTDGKIWANCVGPREKLEGKCDLVKRKDLLRALLIQGTQLLQLKKSVLFLERQPLQELEGILDKYDTEYNGL